MKYNGDNNNKVESLLDVFAAKISAILALFCFLARSLCVDSQLVEKFTCGAFIQNDYLNDADYHNNQIGFQLISTYLLNWNGQ